MRSLLRISVLSFVTVCFSLICINISEASVTLPWSTTFNCADWNQYSDTLNCDGISKGLNATCSSGIWEQITINANNPNGGGGKGQRHWINDGTNIVSGGTFIRFAVNQSEIWIRWYERWQTGFKWKSYGGYKAIYLYDDSSQGGGGVGVTSVTPQQFYGAQRTELWCLHNSSQVWWFETGWTDIFPSGVSDGSWHCYELHVKTNTTTSPANGIAEFWVDGVNKGSFTNVNYGMQSGYKWTGFILGSNTKSAGNGGCAYVDYDDITISATGYIGPLSPPGTNSPVMSNGYPINNRIFAAGTTSVTMSLDTDVKANCKFDSSDVAYSSMANTFSIGQGSSSHSQNITGLQDGHSYTYYARCDVASGGHPDTSSMVLSWNVSAVAIPPVISNPQPTSNQTLAYNTTQTTLGVTTDKLATCKYDTSSKSYASMANTFTTDTTPQVTHSSLLTGLTNGSTYHYYIRCDDGSGGINLSDYTINFSVASSTLGNVLFTENFEDTNFTSRGWYDGPTGVVDCTEHAPISGSSCSLKNFWASSATHPSGGSYIFRHKFAETDSLYISYWIKHTTNWAGSGVAYHPHIFYFLTNQDTDYVGMAYTHLTAYLEELCTALNSPSGTCAGVLQLSMQDGVNINISYGTPPIDLVNITENRAIAGCNGDKRARSRA